MKLLSFGIVMSWVVLAAVNAEEAAYPVYPLEQPPAMDGKWNGPAWENIPEAAGFLSIKTGGLISARQTSFKMGWYGSDLYLAVRCEEPEPDKVKFDASNYRDGWYPDDNLELFFSQDKSPKGFRQFVTNSRAARWSNFASPNATDAWQAACDRGADSWSVEMKIPFSQLGIVGDFIAKPFWFNLGRSSSRNEEAEKVSCFAPAKNGFSDVDRFASLTFRDAPAPEALAKARKTLNRLGNWMRDRLWKIANVKESFLADKQADDKVKQLLILKKQAKKMLESKDWTGAGELIKQYDEQVGEINAPTKQLVVQVKNRDAKTKLYLDGKELHSDSSGKYIARIKEGVSAFSAECAASGETPAVQVKIEGLPETATRWKVSAHEEKGWMDSAFNDAKWPAAAVKEGNFLWAADPASKVFLRQVILWNSTHDGELRCIIPPVKEWGFSENSTDTLFLALYSPLTFPLADYAFQLDMPVGFELLDMNKTTSERSWHGGTYMINCTPEKVAVAPVEHQGIPYNRYTIKYKKGAIPNPGPQKSTFFSLLPVKLNKWNSDKKETCFYYARLAEGNLTEIETKLPVRILPPINGRTLNKIRIQQYCATPYFGSTLSDRHLEEHIKTATSAGFNFWQVNAHGDYGKNVNKMLLAAKASLVAGQYTNYPIWGNVEVDGALLRLLKTKPEFQAKYFNNTSIKDKHYQRYCPSYVTIGEGRSAFKEAVKKDFQEKVFAQIPEADSVWLNWESQSWQLAGSYTAAQKGDESYCFCDRCKKAFQEFAKLPADKPLTDDEIFKNHYKAWADFRSKLDGEVEGIVHDICAELGKKYYLYHGTSDTVLWEACKGKIEHAFPGLPGNGVANSAQQQFLDDSMQFFRTKVGLPRVVGQRFSFFGPFSMTDGPQAWKHCNVLSADGYINAKSWKTQIVRIVASVHEGVDMQSSVECVAGMFYYVGEATRMIAEYEGLFYDGTREDSLAASEQLKYPNLLVLTKGDERLVLLFNESDKPLQVELNNKNLKKGQKASVFESSEKIGNPERMSVTVPAGDVSAVHIK